MFSFLKNIFASSSPKKKFADLLVAEIRRRGLTFPLAFDEKEFKLVSKEPQCVIYLGNMHAHYLAATTPEAKARVIAESASGCFPPVDEEDDEDFASVSPRLMVGFREKCYVEFTKLLMQMVEKRDGHGTGIFIWKSGRQGRPMTSKLILTPTHLKLALNN